MLRPMSRARFLVLGLLPAAPALFVSCNEASVPIGLVMKAPQAIADAESVDLFVFPADGHTCGEDGAVDTIPEEAARFPLSKEGCGEGLVWCGEIVVDRSTDPTMFAAIAKSQGQTLFQGCTATPVDQDPLEITIEMKQFIEPKCCGDGKLQVGEQCDPGGAAGCGGIAGDQVCAPDCTSNEVLLSEQGLAKPFLTNEPHTKSELAMAFCPGNAQTGNALRTLFRSADSKAFNMESDIAVRVMSPDLYTIVEPAPLSLQLRLPLPCWDIYETGGKGKDVTPAIAPVSQSSTVMVYASNEKLASTSDIFLIEHSEDVCADVLVDTSPALQLSQTMQTPGSVTPDVARGPEGTALVVWKQQQQIVGRVWKGGVLVPPVTEAPTLIGNGSAPKVAGNAAGWVVVWEGAGAGDADGIVKRVVGADGVAGAEETVNVGTAGPQIQPDIAMLDSGAYAVVWQSAGDIFFQRYGAGGAAVKGDQEAPLNTDNGGAQAMPSVAAPFTGGVFFATAWENDDGTISARFLGAAGGFLFNSVDGQSGSFVASHPAIVDGKRFRPAVAVGGHVAIGWQDDSDGHPGTYVRRFPLPK
jgi:hypothetical protein